MATIKDLQGLDLKKVNPEKLREAVEKLLSSYKEEEDKKLFEQVSEQSITKLYELVKANAPDALSDKQDKAGDKKKETGKESEPVTRERKEGPKTPQKKSPDAATSKKVLEELKKLEPELEACRATIREYNKKKKEAEPEKPKKSRYTKLKEKLLGLVSLIPENLRDDIAVQKRTEKILLKTHSELVDTWGMSKVKAKPGAEAIKDKFDALEEKQAEKQEKEEKPKQQKKPSVLKVELQYRDGGNYKTHFEHEIDLRKFPEADKLEKGSEIEMGQFGTLTQDDFFGSEIHPHPYDDEMDHNLLEVEEITKG